MRTSIQLTTFQAAEELGLHPETVRRLLQAGSLVGRRLGPRQWRVTRQAITAFKAGGKLRPQGRPRKVSSSPKGKASPAPKESKP